jgi:hypothetical protein
MRLFTAVEENILRSLAHYKFITISQLVKLGVGERSYLSTRLKQLREAGLVGASEYGGVYAKGHGRAENINYLLPRGVKLLAENADGLDMDNIHYPKNIDGIFRNDYFHRISTVNTQIAFEIWAKRLNYEVIFFSTYFHMLGSAKTAKDDNPLRSVTRITFDDGTFIEPDAIFLYETPVKKQLMALEIHNGKDVSRIVQQLKRIGKAVSKGLFTLRYKEAFGVETNPRILCTIETESMLGHVQKRMCSDSYFSPDWMKQAFLFNVAENVWKDFDSGWQNMVGKMFSIMKL